MAAWLQMDIFTALNDVPVYHICIEILLLMWVLWLIFYKNYNPSDARNLTHKDMIELVEEYEPEPLVRDVPPNHRALHPYIITSKAQKYIEIDRQLCINMVTHNYLGFVGNAEIEDNAIATLKKYGVGSCGPRGFYGTVDVHLVLERRLAEFMEMEEAVVYSYGFSTVASAIPAYAKRGDIIFVDENVNFAIQKGLDASRSRIKYFKHNDVNDLELLLLEQEELDRKKPKKAHVIRRFLIVEGIYMNSGDICPLPELIELRNKYKLRIFVDENISFGTLGKQGRGVTEYFNVPKDEVDMIMCSMEWAMASIGGFCVGSSFIVEHQRLSGLGYCFSASLPPLLTTAAIKALDLMEQDTSMFAKLQQCCVDTQKSLDSISHLSTKSHPHSPVKHLRLVDGFEYSDDEETTLQKIADYCIKHGVAVTIPAYLENIEKFPPAKSIRLTVNNKLTKEDIAEVTNVLKQACLTAVPC